MYDPLRLSLIRWLHVELQDNKLQMILSHSVTCCRHQTERLVMQSEHEIHEFFLLTPSYKSSCCAVWRLHLQPDAWNNQVIYNFHCGLFVRKGEEVLVCECVCGGVYPCNALTERQTWLKEKHACCFFSLPLILHPPSVFPLGYLALCSEGSGPGSVEERWGHC